MMLPACVGDHCRGALRPVFAFSPCCGRRCRRRRRMRGAPAWRRWRSVQHPSTVSALRADPPSP
ncbi:MAG: hypothetical protein EOS21_33095, partial [Mesorhizobium sp.]